MKKQTLLSSLFVALLAIAFAFTSCEKIMDGPKNGKCNKGQKTKCNKPAQNQCGFGTTTTPSTTTEGEIISR
jgi:hypothetical protein